MNIMEQLGFPSQADAKQKLFEEMRKVGASRLEAHYSGGNDEGGVDSIDVLVNDKAEAIPVPEMWTARAPKEGEMAWNKDGMVHEYNPLFEAVDAMLTTEFGSWAGDFSAYGTLFADLKENRVWRSGEMSSYDEDGQEY